MRYRNFGHALWWCLLSVMSVGCGTLDNGRGWGQDATLLPGSGKIRHAAITALRDPHTWVPAAGAALFTIDDFDQRVTAWAADTTPVFGSQARAQQASDDLKRVSAAGLWLTTLATPSGDSAGEIIIAKIKGILVQGAAISATVNTTGVIKKAVNRQRPSGGGESFPSAHSSGALVIIPFLAIVKSRGHAAVSICFGGNPPLALLGRS